jgi:sulfonate transport system substrate-binding protein
MPIFFVYLLALDKSIVQNMTMSIKAINSIGIINKPASIVKRPRIRLFAVLGCGLVATFALQGSAGASRIPAKSSAISTTVPPGTTLRFADQFEDTQLPLQLSGEESKLSYPIAWSEFVGGPAVIQALEANAVDVGVLGDAPLAYTQVSHSGLVAFGVEQTNGRDYAIVSAPGEDITSVKGLNGKKVAYTAATGPQAFLYASLQNASLSRKDVDLINIAIQSNTTAALQSHSVDAATLTYPLVATYLADNPTAHLIKQGNLNLTSGQTYFVTTQAVLANKAKEAALGQFIKAFVIANQWRNENSAQWVTSYYVGQEGLTDALGTTTNNLVGTTNFDLVDSATIAAQQKVAGLLTENRAIPRRLDASGEFTTRFNVFVEQGLNQIHKKAAR